MRNVWLILAMVLLCGAKGVGQADSSNLHSLYGEPTLERFTATPQVEFLVHYGIDWQACEILIQPASASIFPTARPLGPMMDEIVVSEILEKLSPTFSRGKAGLKVLTMSGCNEFLTEEFDTVTVNRSFHRCEPAKAEQEMFALITYKRSACESITKARIVMQQGDKQPSTDKAQ
jgi:hypothetical protein